MKGKKVRIKHNIGVQRRLITFRTPMLGHSLAVADFFSTFSLVRIALSALQAFALFFGCELIELQCALNVA